MIVDAFYSTFNLVKYTRNRLTVPERIVPEIAPEVEQSCLEPRGSIDEELCISDNLFLIWSVENHVRDCRIAHWLEPEMETLVGFLILRVYRYARSAIVWLFGTPLDTATSPQSACHRPRVQWGRERPSARLQRSTLGGSPRRVRSGGTSGRW